MNHVVVEEAQAAPDVIIGMILVNDNNAIGLRFNCTMHILVKVSAKSII
jgi:hypothetical protein